MLPSKIERSLRGPLRRGDREVFDYLADFSRTAEWDPGVAEAVRLTPGAVGLGSRFRVSVSSLGRRIPIVYRITEFERPSRLVLIWGHGSLRSIDEITFVADANGRGTFTRSGSIAPRMGLHDERTGRAPKECPMGKDAA